MSSQTIYVLNRNKKTNEKFVMYYTAVKIVCLFFVLFFFIQFSVPFKIISLISRRINR